MRCAGLALLLAFGLVLPVSADDALSRSSRPVANAGAAQTVKTGSAVKLSGAGSSNPVGRGRLRYRWTLTSKPDGSSAILANSNTVTPSFVPDVAGEYEATLTVSNGTAESTSSVRVGTLNSAPVARAGRNLTASAGSSVTLDASQSSDVDGDHLSYSWKLIARPDGSNAALTDASTATPKFVLDVPGEYSAQLVVNDGTADSAPSVVAITTRNSAPVAAAGDDQYVVPGSYVQLDATGSTDVDGDQLSYQWTLISVPDGSQARLNNASALNPNFTADLPGDYVAQLIVSDGQSVSAASTVTISTSANAKLVARAGDNQTVPVNGTVKLNGTAMGRQSTAITHRWALVGSPEGSTAKLSNPNSAAPSFVADKAGTYVAQLVVESGVTRSTPSTVSISTSNSAPSAHAGQAKRVSAGSTVLLDGSASSDTDGDSLSYSWSLLSRPAGSKAALSSATTSSPGFVADVPGVYVAQLMVNDGQANSVPVTLAIAAAGPPVITLTPNPLTLTKVGTGTLTVTLPAPAGVGGVDVNLSSSDSSVVTLPPTVHVNENATGANVTVTPIGLGSATITATSAGLVAGTAIAEVVTPAISVSLPSIVGVTQTINGTVTLSAPAPTGGATIALNSNPAGRVTIPSSIVIPAGSATGTFTLTGVAIGSTTITASSPGYTSGASSISVSILGQILLTANVAVGTGQSVPFPVSLLTPAPVGGVTVTLVSSDTNKVTVSPTTVLIPGGSLTPASQPVVTGVNLGAATITATAPGLAGDSQLVHVNGALAFVPSTVGFGTNSVGQLNLTLSAPASASGLVVNLSSENPAVASVPPTVTFAPNATSVAVPVTNLASGVAVIHASALPDLSDTTVTVNVSNFGAIILPTNVVIAPGQTVQFPVTLAAPAPAGGVTVQLGSNATTIATIAPASVTIPAGATTPATQPQVTGLSFGVASITATAPGLSTITQPVNVNGVLAFSPPSLTLVGPTTQNILLTLSGPAPAALTVNLTSTASTVASVPATAVIAKGASSVSVPVTGGSPGTAKINATPTVSNVSPAVANITVAGATIGTILVQAGIKVGPNQTTSLPISLTNLAPTGGVTIALTSSDPTIATVTPSIFIQAGQTNANPAPQVTGLKFGSVTITASAPSFTTGSATVDVVGTLSFSPQNPGVAAGATQIIALNLNAPAPVGGLTVNLVSSKPQVATVPSNVTIPANSVSVNVPLTGVSAGLATITATSTSPNVDSAVVSATVTPTADINLPSGVVIAPGEPFAFPLTLTQPAPPGGVFVLISSSDPNIVSVTPTQAFIAEGRTTTPATVRILGVSLGTAAITASAMGLTGTTQTVQVGASANFTPSSLTINGTGVTQQLALNLSIPAPAGGFVINLSSSNPAVATVPATFNIPQFTSLVNIPVTSVGAGSTTIKASAANVIEGSATITVISSANIGLPANVKVPLSTSVAFPITLGTAAGSGGVTVSLTSSDPAKISLNTASVFIPQGSTTPATQPQVNAKNIGQVTITATAPGYVTSTQTVLGTAAVSFSQPTLTIGAGSTQNVTLTLLAPAPQGGLPVSLSSDDPSVAQVASTVTFFPDGSQQSVSVIQVKAIAPGTTLIHAGVSPFIPDTTLAVTVVGASAISLPSSLTLTPGQTVSFPITLSTPAPAGGVSISLVSSDSTRVVPSSPSIFIAAGATAPATQPTIKALGFGTVTISGTAPGYSPATSTIQVNGSLTFDPTSITVIGTNTQTLTLKLSAPAPSALNITLNSSNPAVATVQGGVIIGAGSSSATVQVTGVSPGTATITANSPMANITTGSASVTVTSSVLGSISLPANVKIAPNQSVAFPVTLSTPAPAGGVTVSLTSSGSSVSVTPSVFVPGGAVMPASQPQVTGVSFGNANITATAPGYTSAVQNVVVGSGLTFAPSSLNISGATTNNLQLTLSNPAPAGGLTVNLTSSNPAVATVPSSVTIAENTTTANVVVTGVAAGSTTITASAAGNISNATANVTVTTADIILPSGLILMPGEQARLTIGLAKPAPAGGVFVFLSSSDPSKFTVSPTFVFVAEGAVTSVVQPLLNAVAVGSASLNATANGLANASELVRIGTASGFSPASLTFNSLNITQILTLNLATPAPAGGLTIALSSSNTSVATVPATVSFQPGATSQSVPVTSVAEGSAVIHASGTGLPDTTAQINVVTSQGIILPVNAKVPIGQSVAFPISLSTPAGPSGVTLSLISSDPSRISITPGTIFIPQGSTSPLIAAQLTGLNIGTVTITASAPGFVAVSQTVVSTASLAFLQDSITIPVGTYGRALLSLSASAPPGNDNSQGRCNDAGACGITIGLSSENQSIALVQPSVGFFPDGSSQAIVQIPILGVAPGITKIHAGAPPNIPDVTLTVTVTASGMVSITSMETGSARR